MTGQTEASYWAETCGGRWRVAWVRSHTCGNSRLIGRDAPACPRPAGKIPRGERYFDTCEIVERRWATTKLCADCAARPVRWWRP